jgi:DNA invertase Pin-like site-specific DNA recombinase
LFLPRFHTCWSITGIMETTKQTCLIYARCSTRDQETENQLAQLRDYAAKQDWRIAEEIVDVCSGGKASKDRPGLDKVFQLAHRKVFDVLLFWSLDRLSREGSRKTIAYLTMLDDYGVAWHSYSEPYISSLGVFSDCIIALLSALAKQEKLRISERTKAGLERTRRVNGTRLGRPKTPVETIRKAQKLREAGLSFSEIAKRLGVKRTRAFQLVQAAQKASA